MELLTVILFSIFFLIWFYIRPKGKRMIFFVRISHLLQSIIKYFMIEKMTLVYRYDF
jgi:membrane-bound metal-dependent hydrolase YbcI (DUF457 family)